MQSQQIPNHTLPASSHHSLISVPFPSSANTNLSSSSKPPLLLTLFGSSKDSYASKEVFICADRGTNVWERLEVGNGAIGTNNATTTSETLHHHGERENILSPQQNHESVPLGRFLHSCVVRTVPQEFEHTNDIFTPQLTEVVIFGGMMNGQMLNDIWRLRLSSNNSSICAQWIQERPAQVLPALAGHAAVYDADSDSMFVFGGKTSRNDLSNTVYQYSFRYSTWKRVPENNLLICAPRQEHGMVKWGTYLLVFGGNDPWRRKSFRDLWQFDLETREWRQLVARNVHCIQPPESSAPAVELVRNRLYTYSGGAQQRLSRAKETGASDCSHSPIDSLFIYDLDNDMWISVEIKGIVPPPRMGHSLTMIREQFNPATQGLHPDLKSMYPCLLLFGGSSDKGELNDMYEFYDAEVVVQKQHDLTRMLHQRDVEREALSKEVQSKCAGMTAEMEELREEKRAWISKEDMYKAHFNALENNTQELRATIQQKTEIIECLQRDSQLLEEKMALVEGKYKKYETENVALASQLGEVQLMLEQCQTEREEHLIVMEQQQDQITEIQTHSNNVIEQLKIQTNQIGSSHAQLLSELEVRRQEAVNMKIHVQELIQSHKETLGLMKDKYTTELKKMQSTIDAQHREHKSKGEGFQNIIGKLKAQVDVDSYMFGEEWKLSEDQLEVLTKHDGMLDGTLVDIESKPLPSERKYRRRKERHLCSQIYSHTRVENKFVLKTHGVIFKEDPACALIVREKTSLGLREFLGQRQPHIHERVAVCHQVAFAIRTLHKANIVLLSLSPDVIRFAIENERAIPKVCLHLCSNENLHTSFMAPELRTKQNQIDSYKLDIFALGMLFYFLMTDTEPQWKIVKGEFGAISHTFPSFKASPFINTEEGRQMESIIKRCHDIEPSKRPKIDEVLKLVSTL